MTKDPWSQHSIYELIEYIYVFIYQQRAGLRWIMVMMSMSCLCWNAGKKFNIHTKKQLQSLLKTIFFVNLEIDCTRKFNI